MDKIILRFKIFLAKFEKFRINPSKAFVFIYILAFPFGVVHLRYYIENKDLMPNVLQLNNIINGLNAIEDKKVLTSWEGYTIYSNKETIFKDKYFSNFFNYNLNAVQKNQFMLKFPEDYKMLILRNEPDIIVYDEHDPAHLSGLMNEINMNYDQVNGYNYVTIFRKKGNN
jgi:hypothetical protein